MLRITDSMDQGIRLVIPSVGSVREVDVLLTESNGFFCTVEGFHLEFPEMIDYLGQISKDEDVEIGIRLDHIALLEIFLAVGTTEGSTIRVLNDETGSEENWVVLGPGKKIPMVRCQTPDDTIEEIDLIDYGKERHLSMVEGMLNAYVDNLQQDYEETGSKQSTEVFTDCSGNRNF